VAIADWYRLSSFLKKDRDRSQFEITDDILQKLTVIAGVEIKEVIIDPLSPDGETGLIVQVYGYDPIVRQELSNGIKES